MNKLLIGLIGLGVAAGAALQFTGTVNIGDYTGDSLSKIQAVFSQLQADPIKFVQSNIGLIAGGFTVLTLACGAISSLISKTKDTANNQIKQAEAKTTEISNNYLNLEQAKKTVDTALTTKTAEVSMLQDAKSSYTKNISNLESQLAQVQQEKAELKKQMNVFFDNIVVKPKEQLIH